MPSRSLASAQYRDTTVTVYTAGMLPGGSPGDTSAVSGITDSTGGTWTLRRCIEYAMEENITLKKSRIAVEEAKKQAAAQERAARRQANAPRGMERPAPPVVPAPENGGPFHSPSCGTEFCTEREPRSLDGQCGGADNV